MDVPLGLHCASPSFQKATGCLETCRTVHSSFLEVEKKAWSKEETFLTNATQSQIQDEDWLDLGQNEWQKGFPN